MAVMIGGSDFVVMKGSGICLGIRIERGEREEDEFGLNRWRWLGDNECVWR